jgi:hypothetical protein
VASHPALLPSAMTATDVARGVSRLLLRHDYVCMCEVPLANGRRADLLGDGKWPDYLDYCDRFFWAVPQGFDCSPFETEPFRPGVAGLIVADRYDAAIAREAAESAVPAPRRKAATLDFARRAARRLLGHLDPECESLG